MSGCKPLTTYAAVGLLKLKDLLHTSHVLYKHCRMPPAYLHTWFHSTTSKSDCAAAGVSFSKYGSNLSLLTYCHGNRESASLTKEWTLVLKGNPHEDWALAD